MRILLFMACLLLPPRGLSGQPPNGAEAHQPVVVYEIFVRVHGESGTFADVEADLDRLEALGVTTLWLMPVYPLGVEKRKGEVGSPYSVRDYMALNPDMGTSEDFRRLVDAVHARDMGLIIDIVPNHSAPDHPLASSHPAYYRRDAQGRPVPPNQHWTDVIQFDYGHPGTRSHMEEAFRYWLREYDLDGYRVDVAGMVPEAFWQALLPELEAEFGERFFLAEAVGSIYHRIGFDASYDNPLRDVLLGVCTGRLPASRITDHLRHTRQHYPAGSRLLRFTENHDLGRTAALFPAPFDRTAATLVFTVPGIPLLYAGQERGATHTPSLFTREPIDWSAGGHKTEAFYRNLVALRKAHPALSRGTWQALDHDFGDRIVAFHRRHETEEIVVVLNFGRDAATAVALRGLPGGGSVAGYHDLLADRPVAPGPFDLDPGAARVLLVRRDHGPS